MVLLCFRRTYWAELAVGACHPPAAATAAPGGERSLLKLGSHRRFSCRDSRLRLFFSRMRSFNFAQTSSQFSDDNTDHVDDVLDASSRYSTSLPAWAWVWALPTPPGASGTGRVSQSWCTTLHLHVWLKCGITGLVFYLWFHIALLRWVKKARAVAPTQGTQVGRSWLPLWLTSRQNS